MPRRSGGRKARVAIRTAPLAEELKPVRPGESGGQYRPLTDDDTKAIVENSFRILEEVGFSQATPHCIETCTAYGAELGTDQTLSVMQTEYIYPEFSNRMSPNDWKDAGRPDLLTGVVARKKEILSSHVPRHINDEVDAKIRAQFPIFLSRKAMGRG
jgi:trimethylamine:corrinoid methyltransferase-like protein